MKPRMHMAALDDVAMFAKRLPQDFLLCRTWQHSWDPETSTVQRRGGHIHWGVECSICGTVRTCIMTARGEIVGNRYDYPEGYQSAGMGRISRDGRAQIRMETLKRIGGA